MLDLSALGFIESEIVELPVIIVDGKAKLLTPDMKRLDDRLLRDMAKMMGGTLGWVKLRASFSNPEVGLCLDKGCTRIAHYADHKCEVHTMLATTQTVKL